MTARKSRKEEYINEVKQMFNHICLLHDTDLVRVVGFHEDALDYYYHVRYMRCNAPAYVKSDTFDSYGTFVGPCVSLKDIYPRYEHLESTFTLNGCPAVDEFIESAASFEDNEKMYGLETAEYYRDALISNMRV